MEPLIEEIRIEADILGSLALLRNKSLAGAKTAFITSSTIKEENINKYCSTNIYTYIYLDQIVFIMKLSLL